MISSAAFQLNKVRRIIKTHGETVQFVRQEENQFHEPTGETSTIEFKALLHEAEYKGTLVITKSTADQSVLRTKPSIMLLALWEDCGQLVHTDKAYINSRPFIIDGIRNIGEANLIGDISLEEVQT